MPSTSPITVVRNLAAWSVAVLLLSNIAARAAEKKSAEAILALPTMPAWAAEVFDVDRRGKGTQETPYVESPFSFVYEGAPSSSLLPGWQRTSEKRERADRFEYQSRWTDPRTGLQVTATILAFKDFPAVEWVLRFENTGKQDTPILEKVMALDMPVTGTSPADTTVLDTIRGDDCSQESFMPLRQPLNLKKNEHLTLAPVGGRPSNGTFPFFNLDHGGKGMFVAIGWTGQWSATFSRDDTDHLRLKAGMELTHLKLRPGESIRTPRIMLLRWAGDRIDAHNQFRRLLLAHYMPKLDGKPVDLAITAQSFNRTGGQGFWASEAGQIAAAGVDRELGCDTHWFDAGWFEGNFPNGVGNWFPKPKEFPKGLRPIGDACQKLGLKFLVWYEPERVADGTQLAQEHPEFVLPVKKAKNAGGLFNLGDPKARRWLTDLLIRQIAEFNIHTYRNDFNMDPLSFWRQNDPPDRQGITEIRYVEGLYTMWDEMRAKYPRMYMDNCASGGRRIDLEMVMRGVVQTRSDTACTAGRSEWDQCQTTGLSLYLPLHATIGWDVGAYECRSSGAAGFCGEWDILNKSFSLAEAKGSIAEIRENRKYWSGDFYPLTPTSRAADVWMAWQLHRSDLDEGIVLAFRRKDCPKATLPVQLRGLSADKSYIVTFSDDQRHVTRKTMAGRDLAALNLEIAQPHGSLLVRYTAER